MEEEEEEQEEVEEVEEESILSLLEVEVRGSSWARCAWAQVEQTADKVRSSSLQSTPLCGQYTLLERRLSISLSFHPLPLLLLLIVNVYPGSWLPPKAAKCD